MTEKQALRTMEWVYVHVTSLSPDPSSQVGAVLGSLFGDIWYHTAAWNAFPPGIAHDPFRWEADNKADWVIHAEVGSLLKAVNGGSNFVTQGLQMIAPWSACWDCAKAIIAAGVETLWVHKEAREAHPGWLLSIKAADILMQEAGVEIRELSHKFNNVPPIRVNGKLWTP